MPRDRPVLIDTSVWISAIREDGDPAYWQLVDRVLAEGRGATCEVVIAEVVTGAVSADDLSALAQEMSALTCLPMAGAGEEAGRLAWALRRRGLTVHTTDLLIAATAHLHGAALLHCDRHLAEAASFLEVETVQP